MCEGDGYTYSNMGRVAGFQQRPRSVYDIAEAGFRTDKLTLTKIAGEAEGEFKTFIDAIVRHNAVDTYLNTFVTGLKNFTNEKGFYILNLCKLLQLQVDCLVEIQTFKTNLEVKHFLFVKLYHLDLKMVR